MEIPNIETPFFKGFSLAGYPGWVRLVDLKLGLGPKLFVPGRVGT